LKILPGPQMDLPSPGGATSPSRLRRLGFGDIDMQPPARPSITPRIPPNHGGSSRSSGKEGDWRERRRGRPGTGYRLGCRTSNPVVRQHFQDQLSLPPIGDVHPPTHSEGSYIGYHFRFNGTPRKLFQARPPSMCFTFYRLKPDPGWNEIKTRAMTAMGELRWATACT
jgi:hypothetical protein